MKKLKPYFFILPSFFFLAIFTYYPFLNSAYFSLFQYNLSTPQKKFIGLANYLNILQNPLFWQVVKNNLI